MATKSQPDSRKGSVSYDTTVAINTLLGAGIPIAYAVENLSAGGDITARAIWRAPSAGYVLDSVGFINHAASTGIDDSNTAVVTLRNITQSVDVATVTLTANTTANTFTALTLAAANADYAAGDILGIVVTQGSTADLAAITLQFNVTSGAEQIGDLNGRPIA